jgi:non-ribosomal peptide synthetase component F
LSEGLTSELRALSRREGVTLFMLLTAAFQLLLSRYSAQDDIAVGTDIANRQRVEVEPLVGFFVNTLVLRARLSGHETVRELLSQVRETVLGAYEHQELPFDRLVEELVSERDLSRSQLFQHAISLQSKRGEKPWQIGDLRLSSLTLDVATTKRDLDILLFEQDSVEGFAHYDAGLFSAATIERLIRSFQSILEQFARNADAALVDITTERGGELYATQLATSVELLEV